MDMSISKGNRPKASTHATLSPVLLQLLRASQASSKPKVTKVNVQPLASIDFNHDADHITPA